MPLLNYVMEFRWSLMKLLHSLRKKLRSGKAPKSLVVYDRLPATRMESFKKQMLIDDYIKSAKAGKQKDT